MEVDIYIEMGLSSINPGHGVKMITTALPSLTWQIKSQVYSVLNSDLNNNPLSFRRLEARLLAKCVHPEFNKDITSR